MSRLPLRIRLTLPFALTMAVVLAGLGAFVYIRVASTLMTSADQNLYAQAAEALLRIDHGRPLLDRDATGAASVAEVVAPDGRTVTTDPTGLAPLLSRAEIASVVAGQTLRETTTIANRAGPWRLLAIPTRSAGRDDVLVLGASLGDRDESLERLRHELIFSSPLALLIATLAGYILAGAALRPVEAMRRKAEAISAATPDSRLPVPRAKDEISRLAETLNEMLARLETAFEHERRFIAEASHELRTPLALLRTELDLALRKPRTREELEDALRSAAEETDRLTALAADLLLIARSDQRAMPVNPESLSARALLDIVAARFASRAGELGRGLSVELVDDASVSADPRRLEQALGNLVDNALLHGSGEVTLSAERSGERLELHVADDGPGFPEAFAARAFERFSRADEARRRTGSGLGLAIVRSIALAHGGEVGVGVSGSGGADVWISLPLEHGPAPERQRVHLGGRLRRSGASPSDRSGADPSGEPVRTRAGERR